MFPSTTGPPRFKPVLRPAVPVLCLHARLYCSPERFIIYIIIITIIITISIIYIINITITISITIFISYIINIFIIIFITIFIININII